LCLRNARGQGALRDLLNPLVTKVVDDSSLQINTNPVEVYKQWVNQTEAETGQTRSYSLISFLTNLDNLKYPGSSLNLEKLEAFSGNSEQMWFPGYRNAVKYVCGWRSALDLAWGLTLLFHISIIMITFYCDSLWKSKFMVLKKPRRFREFFRLFCGHCLTALACELSASQFTVV